MARPLFQKISLRNRVALLVLALEILLAGIFSLVFFLFVRDTLLEAFDASLRSNAQALGALVRVEEAEGASEEVIRAELETAETIIMEFASTGEPPLFALFRDSGTLLQKSASLANLDPISSLLGDRLRIGNFSYGDTPYRGLFFPVEQGATEGTHPPLRVFFAAPLDSLEQGLDRTAHFLVLLTIGVLILTLPLTFLVVESGMKPLKRLRAMAEGINENSLDIRLPVVALPQDLLPVFNSLNDLIQRLEQAFERERRFSADAAHELRTPVAILKSGLQAALLVPELNGRSRETLKELVDEIQRMEALCETLLLSAENLSSTESPRCAAADWVADIRDTVELLIPQAEARDARMIFRDDLPAPNALIVTDPTATRRIVTNLVTNAINHGGPDVTVAVRVGFQDGGAWMAVRDDGAGVPPSHRAELFDRFFRVDKARSRSLGGGAGLGLAICRALARSQGGDVVYRPDAAQGSHFIWRVRSVAPQSGLPTSRHPERDSV